MTTPLIILIAIATPLGVGCYWFGWSMCDRSWHGRADTDQTACRWRHDWGAYREPEEFTDNNGATYQRRYCKRCNALDVRMPRMHN